MLRAFIITSFALAILFVVLALLIATRATSSHASRPEQVIINNAVAPTTSSMQHTMPFKITSASFVDSGPIPSLYTCDGSGVSPELSFSGVPTSTQSLALIVEDPDVPKALKPDGLFVHWILFNMPPKVTQISSGETVGVSGMNSANRTGFFPPCPPTQYEPSEHRYIFTLYALDTELPLQSGASRAEVLEAIKEHIIAETSLVGKYRRK